MDFSFTETEAFCMSGPVPLRLRGMGWTRNLNPVAHGVPHSYLDGPNLDEGKKGNALHHPIDLGD